MITTTVLKTLGSSCLRMIHQLPAPAASEASTNSRSLSESTSARTKRAYAVQVQMSRMMITLVSDAPSALPSKTAKRMAGMASWTST